MVTDTAPVCASQSKSNRMSNSSGAGKGVGHLVTARLTPRLCRAPGAVERSTRGGDNRGSAGSRAPPPVARRRGRCACGCLHSRRQTSGGDQSIGTVVHAQTADLIPIA